MFKKVLIANRGEIACRIMQSAQPLGIHCIAIYSTVDKAAKHVALADSAYCVGGASSQASYLQQDKIIEIALRHQAKAIHPGYGFLSENADFAKKCIEAGIVFIGPKPSTIKAMGSKTHAKQLLEKAQVAQIPGYYGANQDPHHLLKEAKKIGFPVLIKASSGGGGRGMRVIHEEGDFLSALSSAKREAKSSFDNDTVLLEKYFIDPRHVEIQIAADTHGNVLHLFERDCSMQRRQQKIIEEAPAPALSTRVREQLSSMACNTAREVKYLGVGTVEFLVDKAEKVYFMEMNTRLQVEHAVTEMITGIDLVHWQLLIAANQPLPLRQEQIPIQGHAIEARIYAEDPNNAFMPSIGKIVYLKEPPQSRTLRLDSSIRENDTISSYYDPMLAKLIVHGQTREQAIEQLWIALNEYHIAGIDTNIAFLKKVLQSPDFKTPNLSTQYIENHLTQWTEEKNLSFKLLALAALYHHFHDDDNDEETCQCDPWKNSSGWRLLGNSRYTLSFLEGEKTISIGITSNHKEITLDCAKLSEKITLSCDEISIIKNQITLKTENIHWQAVIILQHHHCFVLSDTDNITLTVVDTAFHHTTSTLSKGQLTAPMPGVIVELLVSPNTRVKQDEPLLVLEAMKMEHTLLAPYEGIVTSLHCKRGDHVQKDSELLKLQRVGESQ
ncbi:MAG: mccA [Gammaproteobacteria bacterium]|jgi:3-methylcrotonyl-CoA carboxylase alpha subunit|nr:mccA [Gammaproteobacteria bacterium]